ncbi:MAG: YfhO family protein [Clostridia bacterium]|nr:YfhO family protein [Clostridia bacterium]
MSFEIAKHQLNKRTNGGALRVFLMALVCAALFFVPYMILDKGYFLFFGDFNVQQIPFYQLCHKAIKSGEIGWNFATDLGVNLIGSYTFYTITSPFFWLTLPFPNAWVPYFMGPLLILKFAFSALTSFLYIRRFTRKTETAQLGALLYAFSGFSVYNIFFNHFHEAIVFFPLLLLAFEMLVTENRRGVFALMVAFCATVNYFFFVGMLVFGIIYFVVRLVSRAIKPNGRQIFAIFFEAVIGILIAFAVLWPSYLAIADNSRITNIELGWNSILYGKESIYANIFEVFFFPPDLPARPVMFPKADVKWSSLGAWMPVFSMVGVFSYCMAKKGNWLKRIIVTCAVMAFVPILNSAFYMFNGAYYVRWFYMPILMMALATAIAIEDREIDWNKSFKYVFRITLIITLVIGFFPQISEDHFSIGLFTQPKEIMYIVRFWVTCFTALGALAVLKKLLKTRRQDLNGFLKKSIVFVLIFAVGYANFFVASGKTHSHKSDFIINDLIEGEMQLEGDADTFRIDTYESMDNSAMFLGYSSINAFHSIVPTSIMEFYEFIGEQRAVASRPTTDSYSIRSLLSVKYLINQQGEDNFTNELGRTEMPGFELIDSQSGFDIYKNNNFVGYGFSYDVYMDYEYCENLSGQSRADHMLTAILLDAKQIEKYGHMFTSIYNYNKDGGATPTTYASISAAAEKLNATSATEFKTGKNSFSATVQRNKETLVFFSIPYDKGWSATVNGKAVPVEKVNVGFMAVPVGAGESQIEFTYKTPGLSLGIVVLVSAVLVLIAYLLLAFVYNKKHPIKTVYPESRELQEIWERDETSEMLLDLPTEIEITEE